MFHLSKSPTEIGHDRQGDQKPPFSTENHSFTKAIRWEVLENKAKENVNFRKISWRDLRFYNFSKYFDFRNTWTRSDRRGRWRPGDFPYNSLLGCPGRLLVMCRTSELMGWSSSLHIWSDQGDTWARQRAVLNTLYSRAISFAWGLACLRIIALQTAIRVALVRRNCSRSGLWRAGYFPMLDL